MVDATRTSGATGRGWRVVGGLLRWAVRLVVWPILLLTLALVLVTQTDRGRALLLDVGTDLLNERILAGTVEIDRLEGTFVGDVRIRGVRLFDAEGQRVATLDEVAVVWSPRGLTRREVNIERVSIEGLAVRAAVLDDGSLDLASLLQPSEPSPPSEPGAPWRVEVASIEAAGLSFVLRDLRNRGARLVDVRSAGLEASASIDTGGPMTVELDRLWASVAPPFALDAPFALRVERLHVGLEGDRLAATVGRLRVQDSYLESIDAAMELDPSGASIFERLRVELPDVHLDPDVVNAAVGSELLRVPLTVRARIEGPVDAVALDLSVDAESSSVGATLVFDLRDPAVPGYAGELELVRFRPEAWLALDGVEADTSLILRAEGRGITPDAASFRAVLDVAPSRFLGYAVEGVYASVGFAERTLTVHSLEAWSDGARLAVAGTADLDGEVALRVSASVAELAAIARYQPEMDDLRGSARIELDLATRIDPDELSGWADRAPAEWVEELVPRTRLALDASVRRLEVAGARVGSARVTASSPGDGELRADASMQVEDATAPGVEPGLRTASVDLTYRDEALRGSLRVMDTERRSARVGWTARLDDDRVTLGLRELVVDADPLALRLIDEARIRADFAPGWAFQSVEADPFALMLQGQRVTLGGAFHSAGTWRGTVRFDDLEIGGLLSSLAPWLPELPELGGRLSVDAAASGSLQRPEFRVALRLEDGLVDDLDGLGLELETRYTARTLRATLGLTRDETLLLELDTGEHGIPLDLALDGRALALRTSESFSLAVDVPPLEVAQWVEGVEALEGYAPSGRVELSLALGGTPIEPWGEVRARLEEGAVTLDLGDGVPTRLRGIGFGLALDVLERAPDELRLKSAVIWNGRRIAQMSGQANLLLRDVLDGQVAPEDWVRALQGELDVLAGPVRLDEFPLFLRQSSGLDNGSVFARLMLRGGVDGGRLEGHVNLFDLIAPGLPQTSVRVDYRSEEQTEVVARVVAGNTYSARRWRSDDAWDLSVPALVSPRDDDVAAARATFRSEQGLRELVQLGPSALARLAARVHVEHLPPSLLVEEPALAGVTVDGWLDLTGPITGPEIRGRFGIHGLALATGESGTLGLEIRGDADGIELDASACASEFETVRMSASTRWGSWPVQEDFTVLLPEWRRLPLRMELVAERAPIEGLVPSFLTRGLVEELSGTLNANLSVRGSLDFPHVDGVVELEEVGLALIPLNRTIDRVDARVRLTNDELNVDEFVIRDGGGRFDLGGRISLAEFLPTALEFEATLDRFYAAGPTGPGAYVDGVIRVSGEDREGLLDVNVLLVGLTVAVPDEAGGGGGGPVELPETVYFLDESIPYEQLGQRQPRTAEEIARAEANGGDVAAPSVDLRADVRVRTTGTNRIEHALANVEFATDVSARIRPDGVRLSGFVSVPSGRLSVAGRQFEIARGYVQLSGDVETLDPVVDLRATHTLSPAVASRLAAPSGDRATVTIVVDAQVSELLRSGTDAIRLISDPEMPPEDVIFVLFTGRPRDEETEADGQQQALATAGSLLLGLLGDRLAGGTVIDTLSIEGDAQSGQAIARVEGGKYISEDLYLSGAFINSQDPEDNNFEVALQWIIARFRASSVRAELRAGNRARGGVELLYFFSRRGRSRTTEE